MEFFPQLIDYVENDFGIEISTELPYPSDQIRYSVRVASSLRKMKSRMVNPHKELPP